MSDVFILIQESCTDVEASVYRRKDAAVDAACGVLIDCGGVKRELSLPMLKAGCVFSGTYGEDGKVRVVRTQVKG